MTWILLLSGLALSGEIDPTLSRGAEAGAPSGPQAELDGPALVSLDFTMEAGRSRVAIGLQGVEGWSVRRDPAGSVVLTAPGAALPVSLTRPLDTSQFASPVHRVRTRTKGGAAEVVVELSSLVPWSSSEEGGLIWLDFTHPESADAPPEAVQIASPEPAQAAPAPAGVIISEGGAVRAADAAGQLPTSSARRISLDLVEADIHDVLRLFAEVSNINIIAGDDVSGTVTVRLVEVPWDQALAAVLRAKGLGATQFGGNLVQISTVESIAAMYSR